MLEDSKAHYSVFLSSKHCRTRHSANVLMQWWAYLLMGLAEVTWATFAVKGRPLAPVASCLRLCPQPARQPHAYSLASRDAWWRLRRSAVSTSRCSAVWLGLYSGCSAASPWCNCRSYSFILHRDHVVKKRENFILSSFFFPKADPLIIRRPL